MKNKNSSLLGIFNTCVFLSIFYNRIHIFLHLFSCEMIFFIKNYFLGKMKNNDFYKYRVVHAGTHTVYTLYIYSLIISDFTVIHSAVDDLLYNPLHVPDIIELSHIFCTSMIMMTKEAIHKLRTSFIFYF